MGSQVILFYSGEGVRMQQLFSSVVEQFKSFHQYDRFLKESEKEYDIKIYRLLDFKLDHAYSVYAELLEKYQNETLKEYAQGWHENERRLYVWFIVCFIHMKLLDPIKFIDAQKYQKYWKSISETFWNKDIAFLKYQLLTIIKSKGRTTWKAEEDQLLREAYHHFDKGQWNQVAKYFYIQSRGLYFKTPKQCRQRWQNHLNGDIKKGKWTPEEDRIIFQFVRKNGQKWARIIPLLHNSRTEHMIKNRFKSVNNRIMQQQKVSESQATNIYLKQLTGESTREVDNSLRDENGILHVQSQQIIDDEPEEIQKTEKVEIKRGRKPKNKIEVEQSLNNRLVQRDSFKPERNSLIGSNRMKINEDGQGCIIEGLSNSKINPFIFNSINYLDNSRNLFDSVQSGLFHSSRYSANNQGFTVPIEDGRSFERSLLNFERDSIKRNNEAELDALFGQRQSFRSRRPSIIYPNDSYFSGIMK